MMDFMSDIFEQVHPCVRAVARTEVCGMRCAASMECERCDSCSFMRCAYLCDPGTVGVGVDYTGQAINS